MVGFNKTKSELGTLQDALAKTQIDLEKTNFELHAKKSELLPLSLAKLAGFDNTHDTLAASLYATRALKSAAAGCLSRCVTRFGLYAHSHVIVFHCISQLKEANEPALKLMQRFVAHVRNMNMICCVKRKGDHHEIHKYCLHSDECIYVLPSRYIRMKLPVMTVLHAQVNVTSHQES